MIISKMIDQRSEAWFTARAGKITASNFGRLLTPAGKPSAQREDLVFELCASSINPMEIQWGGNIHTDRGEELEPEARDLFRATTGFDVREVGFILMRENPVAGCSPDGLIYAGETIVSGLEIKCPLIKNHAKYALESKLPDAYRAQVHGSMAVTGLNSWHFMSYARGCKPFIIKVERDEYTEKIKEAITDFTIHYAEKRKKIMEIIEKKGALA